MNSWFHRTFVYGPSLRLRGEHATWRMIEQKRALLGLSPNALARHVSERLALLIAHAERHVPFYRDTWGGLQRRSSEDPASILEALPTISKRTLQESANDLRAPHTAERVWKKSTGGSTAEPVTIWKNASGLAEERAATWMALNWVGIHPGDRVARFWSTPLTNESRRRFQLADLAMNRIRVSAFEMDDAAFERHWRACLRFRPKWLYGYTSMLDLLAGWLEEHGRDGRELGLTAIVPTSEPLYDAQRARIARVFGCSIQNEYGCGEVGAIAYECDHGRLHVMADNVVCEVLRDDGARAMPGETGEVVVTDLTNFAMPLIRYRMGDRAEVAEPCPCGISYPALRSVVGRTYDEMFTPTGRRWNGWQLHYFLSTLMGEHGGFRQYQVVQTAASTLDVRLVADETPAVETVRAIEAYVRTELDGMHAVVHRVDAVERSKSGKLRVVRNDWLHAIGGDHPT